MFIWSAINPKDYFVWFLEALPAILGLIIISYCYVRKKFIFTSFSCLFILIHAIILMIGAHYTYSEVPLFNWLKDIFDLERNNYDKVGHFAQGFVPALLAREILIRCDILKNKNWMFFIIICICLAISSCYEILEWIAACVSGDSADAFLGLQGYSWDTHSDMFFALLGAVVFLVLFSKIQDKYFIRRLNL